ncbi:MAG: polysaccharide biosynthesis C-terminal domain-containing protein [Candidatus Limnocylindrales bacterium]
MAEPSPGRSLKRAALHTLSVGFASVILSFVASVAVARILGASNKGAYDLAIASATLLTLLLGFSIPAGTTYVVARGGADTRSLCRWLAVLALVQGAIAIVLVWALRLSVDLSNAMVPARLGEVAAIQVGMVVAFMSAAAYFRAILLGQQRISAMNWRDLLGRCLAVALILAAAAVAIKAKHSLGPGDILWITLAGTGLSALLYAGALRGQPKTPRAAGSVRPLLAYALPTYLANVIQFLNYRLDLFLVGVFLGLRAVGLYALAVTLAQLLLLVSSSASTVLLPRVAAEQSSVLENVARTARGARFTLWISLVCAVALASLGHLFISAAYGADFGDSARPLVWLLPGIVALAWATVMSAYISGIGRPKINLLISCVSLLVTLVGDLLLIPRLGISGAALTSSASYSLTALLTSAAFLRLTRCSLRTLIFPSGEDRRMAARLLSVVTSVAGGRFTR